MKHTPIASRMISGAARSALTPTLRGAPQSIPCAENGYGADLAHDTITQALWDGANDPQAFPCKADGRGICPCCDTVVDRAQFFAFYPDAPDTDWRPWMTEPVEDAPRLVIWDFTR